MSAQRPYDISKARPQAFAPDRVGVRTEYAGVSFRSRLEAKWAALFDLLHWSWSYEPLDLSGYIPDFVIDFARAPLLVEVKPETRYGGLPQHARPICLSGWRGDFLIVGSRLIRPESDEGRRAFGLLGLWDRESADGWQPADHGIAIQCHQCSRFTLKHASGAWYCLGCGACDPRAHFEDAEPDRLEGLWAQASNIVQWRPCK